MSDKPFRPAWSSQFSSDAIRELHALGPIGELTREWAWGSSSGKGVRVAIIDSGIEKKHPALEKSVQGGVVVEWDAEEQNKVRYVEDNDLIDLSGHGTACAGIIHQIAPAEYYALFHELADKAYFNNITLVSAVNNIAVPSYPSLYSSVISVAAHDCPEPMTYYYNPSPPVEFGALGINVEVSWLNGGSCVTTGNSFAAPHIAGIVALIRAEHPDLTPFQIKTILFACASNTHGAPAATQES